jgi:F-type H+-transporting ATPase subunit b
MPQFNPEFWVPQLFWLAIVSVVLFVVMWRVTLPRVDSVFTDRQGRVSGNLERAEALKLEAETALASYHKAMADARSTAQAEHARAAAAIAAETAKREAVFGKKLGDQASAAEREIAGAKAEALKQVQPMAADLVLGIAEKLIGTRLGADTAAAAVAATVKERS